MEWSPPYLAEGAAAEEEVVPTEERPWGKALALPLALWPSLSHERLQDCGRKQLVLCALQSLLQHGVEM